MKRLSTFAAVVLLLSAAAFAQQSNWQFLTPLKNARFVYVTSYDGPQFAGDLLPSDLQAISAVQNAVVDSGRYTVVYSPEKADVILVVQSRPSEDLLAVYDGRAWPDGDYLWRAMQKNGFKGEMPLYQQLSAALERAGS
jgi:hypothetical protein